MKLVISSIFFLVILKNFVLIDTQTNYCNPALCKNRQRHIGCNNNGDYSVNCRSDAEIMPITSELRRNILVRHNRWRGRIARGGFAGRFRPAIRMATMQWGGELAYLAELNVKQCVMTHDGCRSTNRFRFAGQNLARTAFWGLNMTVESLAMTHIDLWFNEYQNTSVAMMRSLPQYPSNGNFSKDIGHFTQMMQEKATHVGCAILRQSCGNSTYQFMACNYAYMNVYNMAVYRMGNRAGTRCLTGRNPRFRSLCSRREKYNENVLGY